MKFLLDTCLISEIIRREPNRQVLRWLESQEEAALFLSVLTLGELQKGIAKLPDSPKKSELQAWVSNDLAARFEGRLLPIDGEVAATWGRLLGTGERQGKKLPVMDSLIAATAITHNLTVVTRNTRDLERSQAKVFNSRKD